MNLGRGVVWCQAANLLGRPTGAIRQCAVVSSSFKHSSGLYPVCWKMNQVEFFLTSHRRLISRTSPPDNFRIPLVSFLIRSTTSCQAVEPPSSQHILFWNSYELCALNHHMHED